MKKASLFASTLALAAIGVTPAMAQDGPFKDVPNDHWAYQALDRLAKDKIVVGDPDGRYQGKRTLTRYEMAMVIDRLIRLLDERYVKAPLPEIKQGGGISQADLDAALSGIVKQGDLSGYAKQSDLSGFAKQSDIDLLRKLAGEFQTELTTLGADVDGIKKKLDGHEKRIAALEDAWKKRVQVSGSFNTYTRSTHRKDTNNFRDRDGYLVTGPAGLLADTRALHDFDLNIKANPAANAAVDISLNFGNYLDYLGSTTNFTGVRSGVGLGAQDQTQTITKAVLSTGVSLPVIGSTALQIGRVPTQLTNLTFKGFDVDTYFGNSKTEGGNITVDGVRAGFKIGRFGISTVAARVDPVRYSSNISGGNFVGDGAYGLMAGASRGAYTGGLTRNNVLGTSIGKNGAGMVDQLGAARINLLSGGLTLNATGLWSGIKGGTGFNALNVYGADAAFRLLGLNFNAEYAKSQMQLNGTEVAATNKNNEALDASASLGSGNWSLKGGYRKIDSFFGAPGSWARLGSWVNPTDIQGGYGTLNYNFSGNLSLNANTQSYQGTGKVTAGNGGLSKQDKVTNLGAALKLNMTSASTLEVGTEFTEFTTAGSALKPRETFTNIAYGYNFSPAASLRLLYQIVDYKTKGNATFVNADGANQKGGVLAGQFSVKF